MTLIERFTCTGCAVILLSESASVVEEIAERGLEPPEWQWFEGDKFYITYLSMIGEHALFGMMIELINRS